LRSRVGIQAGGLRVRMRSALRRLSARASDGLFLLVPRPPSWPQGRWGTPLALLASFLHLLSFCRSSIIVARFVAHRTVLASFPAHGSSNLP
jgi:hypothetical protein